MNLDWDYIHLLINHFPIILTVMGASAAVVGLIMKRRGLWLYAVASLTLAGLTIYPALWTGERAEHALERAWFVQRGSIHTHEEAAELAMWVVLAMGAVALYAWVRALRFDERMATMGHKEPPGWLRVLVVLLALAGVGTITWASVVGGHIVHDSAILSGPRPAGVPEQPRPTRPPSVVP